MNTAPHIEQDDLALFAMQLLDEVETANILQHLEHCDDCRRELGAAQGDLAVYAHTVELHSPPAMARERLLKQVAREKKIVPIAPRTAVEARAPESRLAESRPAEAPFRTGTTLGIESSYLRAAYVEDDDSETTQRGFAGKVLPWAGWAIAAGMAVAAGNFYHQRNNLQSTLAGNTRQLTQLTADAAAARQLLDTLNDTTALRVTLQKPQTAPVPQARATYVADKGSLLFIASNMEPLQAYKVYELWLIPADGHDPIPAGTFHPDIKGNASVILPALPKGVEAKAFGITIEDEGGATTPTLPIIMAGA